MYLRYASQVKASLGVLECHTPCVGQGKARQA